jgi:hypothetical protein
MGGGAIDRAPDLTSMLRVHASEDVFQAGEDAGRFHLQKHQRGGKTQRLLDAVMRAAAEERAEGGVAPVRPATLQLEKRLRRSGRGPPRLPGR